MLAERHRERESPLVDVNSPPHCVECDSEECAV
jgi:hypothetical protein